jgi:uncharacterized membrane protein
VHKGRLEAFSDGVIAILITIMVLELKTPQDSSLAALGPMGPVFISYLLSFIMIAIYWNNHHHLLQAAEKVNGPILWANMHLLFWLSLIPFATAWMGQNGFAQWPVIIYGIDLLLCGVAYYLLSRCLVHYHGRSSTLAHAVGSDFKGKISVIIYLLALAVAFYNSWWAYILYIGVAILWLVPDRRIERVMDHNKKKR